LQGGPKTEQVGDFFLTPVCDNLENHSICQNIQFCIWSKTSVLNVTQFIYSLCLELVCYVTVQFELVAART